MARQPIIITVDRVAAASGAPAVRVEYPDGSVTTHRRVVLGERSSVVQGEPRRDGATVWVETDDVIV